MMLREIWVVLPYLLSVSAPALALHTRNLVLPNLPTALGALASNISASGGTRCSIVRGTSLSSESCEEAWLKIPTDGDFRVFRHRRENPPASAV